MAGERDVSAIMDTICDRLASGETLRSICRTPGMPPESTVRRWVMQDRDDVAAQYARARDLGIDGMVDELLEIAERGSDDWQRDRLRVDAIKWYVAKCAPKKYGDRIAHEHSGPGGDAIRVGLPADELQSLRAYLSDIGVTDVHGAEGTD